MSAGVRNRLGFGCAHLPGRHTRADAAALAEAALDAGIRHFDVARMYGDGRAEAVLGEVAKRRRGEMVIVTKAGINPASRALPARLLRRGMQSAPFLAKWTPPNLRRAIEPAFGQFAAAQVRASLEASLRELATDYVDALLLHECELRHISDELKRELDLLVREGKARAIGVAPTSEAAPTLVTAHPDLCAIVQLPVGAAVTPPPGAWLIVHSVFGARLAGDAAARIRPDRAGIAAAMLRQAMLDHPQATVLFSSNTVEHIQRNAALAAEFDIAP